MPPRGRKRKSDQSSIASPTHDTPDMVGQKIAAKLTSPTGSPSKKRKIGITVSQKQALIDNLQLEVTERARKLRAQYNLQAQGLRTRIEIRVNRIPMALRKLKVGDLLRRHTAGQSKPMPPRQIGAAMADRVPPPLSDRDYYGRGQSSPRAAHAGPGRPPKRPSDNLLGGDKENQNTHFDGSTKRPRINQQQQGAAAAAAAAPHAVQMPAQVQVLSPASSNSRLNPRDREYGAAVPSSPVKSFIARPVSPAKQAAATTLLSSMVEKARSTRAAATRKPLTSSTTSSAGGTGSTRPRKGTVNSSTTGAASRSAAAATQAGRRASGASESSDASTSTVVRKAGRGRSAGTTSAAAVRKATTNTAQTATATATSSTKKTVMSSIKKGVANAAAKRSASSKAAASAAAAAAAGGTATAATTSRSGRILRKRD